MTCGYFVLNRYQRYLSSLMHAMCTLLGYRRPAIRAWADSKMKNVNNSDFRVAINIPHSVASIHWPKYVLELCFFFDCIFFYARSHPSLLLCLSFSMLYVPNCLFILLVSFSSISSTRTVAHRCVWDLFSLWIFFIIIISLNFYISTAEWYESKQHLRASISKHWIPFLMAKKNLGKKTKTLRTKCEPRC